uniref:Cell division protein CDC48AP n=1 Tax=Toxoplasma gondii COUG TaxID=1074873 RepID=A0A2G8XUM0_TOXGO|nr:cell division protein CDC48AP [Toxoplasma gondii COUG]
MQTAGADITEICQRAAKNAVRESIQAEVARGRPLAEGEKDPVPFISKKHFDEAFKGARKPELTNDCDNELGCENVFLSCDPTLLQTLGSRGHGESVYSVQLDDEAEASCAGDNRDGEGDNGDSEGDNGDIEGDNGDGEGNKVTGAWTADWTTA